MATKKAEEVKSLEDVAKELNKKYGDGSVIFGDEKPEIKEVVSTGSLGLDIALGCGGIPKGRGTIVEMYGWESSGKSTLAQKIIANFQKAGVNCLLVDGEGSLDAKYATAIGVDLKKLFLVQLDEHAGEGAYDKMESLVETGQIGLVVIDSYNALQPLKVVEGDMSESAIGLHARMLGKAVMKANSLAAAYGTVFLFLGQLREKIGVMFGCLHADMPIIFTDGKSFPIKKVVEEKIKGEVWSFNEDAGIFEPRKIIDWHYNGDVNNYKDYIHLETTAIQGNRFGITVTPSHEILTEKGWKEAQKIDIGENLVSKYESIMGADGEEFLKGCLIGDSHLSMRNKNTASLRLQDKNNPEYIKWKRDILSTLKWSNTVGYRWDSEYTYEFGKLKKQIENRNPLKVFTDGKISDLALAVWIMDDGHYRKSHKSYLLSVKRFKDNPEVLEGIKELFLNKGLNCSYNKEGGFLFSVDSSTNIAERIRMYIPKCMEYKLPEWAVEANKSSGTILPTSSKIIKSEFVQVLSKRFASPRQMRQKGKYDISVEGNHNYISGGIKNGVVVHNSPETTQGGNSLKFYSHIRMKVSRSTTNENSVIENDLKMGNKTKVEVIKNKYGAPFRNCTFNILYGKGIDTLNELIDLAHDYEIVKKYGKTITYDGVKHEASDFKQLLIDNPDMFEEIRNKVLTHKYPAPVIE